MLTSQVLLLAGALGASAHYTFPKINSGSDWQHVRRADNWQSNGFVDSIGSVQMRCFQNSFSPAPATMQVAAGGSVTYHANNGVFHPGPMQFYMARVPDGQDINSFTGEGNVWFKIYAEQPGFGSQLTWPSLSMFLLCLYQYFGVCF